MNYRNLAFLACASLLVACSNSEPTASASEAENTSACDTIDVAEFQTADAAQYAMNRIALLECEAEAVRGYANNADLSAAAEASLSSRLAAIDAAVANLRDRVNQ